MSQGTNENNKAKRQNQWSLTAECDQREWERAAPVPQSPTVAIGRPQTAPP